MSDGSGTDATAHLGSDSARGWLAIRGGAALAAVHFGLLFHWVPVALFGADPGVDSAAFAAGAYLVIVTGLAALTALFFGLLHHAVNRLHAPLWLALAVIWTGLEWTRGHLPDSLALPWLGLGTSLTGYPELAGAAEIVGARGLTFWLAAVNGLVATAWMRRDGGWRRWCGAASAAVALTVAVGGWGIWRAGSLELRPAGQVAVVQPAVARRTKVDGTIPSAESVAAALPSVASPLPAAVQRAVPLGDERTRLFALPPGPLDLVVLPELFLRADPRSPDAAEAVALLQDFSRRVGAPVLFGAVGGAPVYASPPATPTGASLPGAPSVAWPPRNSAFVMAPDGLEDFRYDKRRLVPVVERIPFRSATPESGYVSGRGWPLVDVADVRYGVLICYESSYPEVARALRLAGADVLVNVTNDAWLGGPGAANPTVALWQHPAHAVMRAIEGRVGVVRGAATGISLFVDPVGRIHERTDVAVREVRGHQVQTVDGPTFYIRFGDLMGTASAVLALSLLLHAIGRRTSRATPPDR